MADLTSVTGNRSWFAVFPDCAAAAAAAQLFTDHAPTVVPHASGRPWLVGRWADDDVRVAAAGPTRLAMIGTSGGTADDLARWAGTAATKPATALCRDLAAVPGCFHVVAAVAGQIVVRGTASGLRRVFHARIHGVTVVADHAGVLAAATRAAFDEATVAAAMLAPSVPHPLEVASLWRGVAAAAPDHCVAVRDDGTAQVARWWTAPSPGVPLAAGAAALREALRAAVDVRTAAGGTVSADLSGGVDSTGLCFLAAEGPVGMVTTRVAPLDPGNSDPEWADRAAASLTGAVHVVIDPADVFTNFDPLARTDGEEPVGGLMTHAVIDHVARIAVGRGSRLHVGGYGGDEVVGVSRAYVRDLLFRRPAMALSHLRAHRSLRRWRFADTVRALADGRSFGAWLTVAADGLTRPRPLRAVPQFGWGAASHAPPWTTPAAVASIRERLVAAAAAGAPLAPQRAQHRAVTAVWSAAQAARKIGRLTADAGLPLAAPFLDDTVVAAALTVDLADRGTPWQYKPLLAEAMRPVVPVEVWGRRSKGLFAAEGIDGIRRQRTTLLALCEDSELARLGLVDAEALRAACLTLDTTGFTAMAVDNTMAVELWLRAAARRTGEVAP